MAGFLLTSVAIPAVFTGTGLLFALGYLVLTIVHLVMFSRSEVGAAAIRLAPYNLGAVLLVGLAAFVTGPAAYALWVAAALVQAALPYLTPRHSWIRVAGNYQVVAAHLVERHGLLVIVASVNPSSPSAPASTSITSPPVPPARSSWHSPCPPLCGGPTSLTPATPPPPWTPQTRAPAPTSPPRRPGTRSTPGRKSGRAWWSQQSSGTTGAAGPRSSRARPRCVCAVSRGRRP